MNEFLTPIHGVPAQYTPQRITRFQGNRFIEALPQAMSDEEVLEALTLKPDFSIEQRVWANHERIQQIKSLSNFMVPLSRHLKVARAVDSMLRESYVGRSSGTPEYMQKLVDIYRMQKSGKTFAQSVDTVSVMDVIALLGIPGMGKTTFLRRWLAHYPQVIYHAELDVTQVSYLYLDMKNHGDSVKALLVSVILQLDRLLPSFGYAKLYLKDVSRTSVLTLVSIVSRLMHIHQVGLLVVDEIQNLANHPKGAQQVMTELVTMCNELRVAILFVGTNKAAKVLGADFRQARRSTGLSAWDRLPRYDAGNDSCSDQQLHSEWADLIQWLWTYQWVKTPLGLNEDILDLLYDLTQGVIDLAIKLFAIAQVQAILSGTDRLTPELLQLVYDEHFTLLHPALQAIAENDLRALARYEDVAPVRLDDALENLLATTQRAKNRARLTKPGDPSFVPRLAAALVSAGFDKDAATTLAKEVEARGSASDIVEAMRQVQEMVKPPARPTRKAAARKKATDKEVEWPDFSERPADYRRAEKLAAELDTSVFEQLEALGMARNVEELVPLE